jgi:flagellar motor switch protein FliN
MTPPATTALAPALTPEALAETVAAAAEDFPAVGLQAGPADVQEGLDDLLPGPDAAVVVVPIVHEARRDVFVIVSPALMASMGATDVNALTGLVERTIAELAAGADVDAGSIRLGTGADALADLPHGGTGGGAVMVAAGVFAGVDHVATVGVAVHPVGVVPSETVDDVAAASDAPAAASDAPAAMDLPSVAPAPERAPSPMPTGGRGLDLLGHVEMNVVAELGRTRMTVADLLGLAPGAVVELDRAAGSPIDLLVNGTLIARGEVVVIDEEFGLRISEIVDGSDGH